ncbi:hypothetical protein N8261_04810 [Flavobacteriaceae bacterium]|nr:hypothetical protein [Flavobacteriaceae bacterium]
MVKKTSLKKRGKIGGRDKGIVMPTNLLSLGNNEYPTKSTKNKMGKEIDASAISFLKGEKITTSDGITVDFGPITNYFTTIGKVVEDNYPYGKKDAPIETQLLFIKFVYYLAKKYPEQREYFIRMAVTMYTLQYMINENNTKKSMKGGMMADGDVDEFANVQLAFQQAGAADYVGNEAMIRYGEDQQQPMNLYDLVARSDRGDVLTNEEMQAVVIGREQRVLMQAQRVQDDVIHGVIPHKDKIINIQYSASAGACCCITVNAVVRAATTIIVNPVSAIGSGIGSGIGAGASTISTGATNIVTGLYNNLPESDAVQAVGGAVSQLLGYVDSTIAHGLNTLSGTTPIIANATETIANATETIANVTENSGDFDFVYSSTSEIRLFDAILGECGDALGRSDVQCGLVVASCCCCYQYRCDLAKAQKRSDEFALGQLAVREQAERDQRLQDTLQFAIRAGQAGALAVGNPAIALGIGAVGQVIQPPMDRGQSPPPPPPPILMDRGQPSPILMDRGQPPNNVGLRQRPARPPPPPGSPPRRGGKSKRKHQLKKRKQTKKLKKVKKTRRIKKSRNKRNSKHVKK